jgi:hypothetical protein
VGEALFGCRQLSPSPASTCERCPTPLAEPSSIEILLSRQLPHGLVLMPMTTDVAVARTWMLDHTSAGIEA